MSRYDFDDEMDRIEDEQDFDNEAYNELDDLDDYYDSEDQLGLPPYMDYYEEEDYYDFPESWEEGPWYDPQDGDYL